MAFQHPQLTTPPLATPTTAYLFPLKIDMTPPELSPDCDGSRLLAFLSQGDLTEEEVRGGLEEFAWRGMSEGRRVRDMCGEVDSVVERLHNTTLIRKILSTPPLSTFFPLVNLASNSYFPSLRTNSLLPAFELDGITRKQLIAALVRLSRQDIPKSDTEGLIVEVCLEYVGRRWRGAGDGEDGLEEMAKKLTEVEFEIQLQGNPTTIRSTILPAAQKVRFHLGLTTSSQLVIRLQSLAAHLDGPYNPLRRSPFEAQQLISAWLSTRLRASGDPQALVDELIFVREKLRHEGQKEMVSTVLGDFGLLGRGRSREDSVLGQFGLVHPSSPPPSTETSSPISLTKSPKRNSNSSTKASARKTMAGVPKWWSHRRNTSSTSRLQAGVYSNDRRPSLPVISTSMTTLSHLPWGTTTTSLNSTSTSGTMYQSRLSLSTTRESSSVPNLLSSMLTFSDPEDMRFILLDHLLGMRYQLTSNENDDWFLGNGKQAGGTLLEDLDRKLIRRKDVIGLRGIFSDLRLIFGLPARKGMEGGDGIARQSIRRRLVSHLDENLVGSFPVVPTREQVVSPFPQSIHERDASFDLDQYISDIAIPAPTLTHTSTDTYTDMPTHSHILTHSPTPSNPFSLELLVLPDNDRERNPKRASIGSDSMITMTSVGAESIFSIMGALNLDGRRRQRQRQPTEEENRVSMLSSFTIREATREWPLQDRGVGAKLVYPGQSTTHLRRANSFDTLDITVEGESGRESSTPSPGSDRKMRRRSRSDTDLTQWASLASSESGHGYGTGSLRRRERITPLTTSLSAYDLGLASCLPKTPNLPPHIDLQFDHTVSTPQLEFTQEQQRGADVDGEEGRGCAGLLKMASSTTPRDGEKRLYRQFAIVDGEHVSPTKGFGRLSNEISQQNEEQHATKEESMRRESWISSSSPSLPLDGEIGKSALEIVMGLFTPTGQGIRARDGLDVHQVQQVLERAIMVEQGGCHSGNGGNERVAWLVQMVGNMLNDRNYDHIINLILYKLEQSHSDDYHNGNHQEGEYNARASIETTRSISTHSSFSTGTVVWPPPTAWDLNKGTQWGRAGGKGIGIGIGIGLGERTMSCFSTATGGTFGRKSEESMKGMKGETGGYGRV